MIGWILIVRKVLEFSDGSSLKLWMFIEKKLILNAIVVNMLISFQVILRISKKKNAMEKKCLHD